ncbi:hypothetical protein EVAR_48791_1 [Eumeta japonica]|uniref:Uncharacterized protein n=1 Tax=Eumeta variegata TaxID=151549 RepID=A0A4C1Y344_EUMVA|nr:hypothetical protein EVAR_48791_1 [Eumeta japonica]
MSSQILVSRLRYYVKSSVPDGIDRARLALVQREGLNVSLTPGRISCKSAAAPGAGRRAARPAPSAPLSSNGSEQRGGGGEGKGEGHRLVPARWEFTLQTKREKGNLPDVKLQSSGSTRRAARPFAERRPTARALVPDDPLVLGVLVRLSARLYAHAVGWNGDHEPTPRPSPNIKKSGAGGGASRALADHRRRRL